MTALCMVPPAMVLVIILCCLCMPQGHLSVLTLQKEVITENSSVLNATKFCGHLLPRVLQTVSYIKAVLVIHFSMQP